MHVIELMNTLAIDSHCAEGARRAGYGALAPKAPAERPDVVQGSERFVRSARPTW